MKIGFFMRYVQEVENIFRNLKNDLVRKEGIRNG